MLFFRLLPNQHRQAHPIPNSGRPVRTAHYALGMYTLGIYWPLGGIKGTNTLYTAITIHPSAEDSTPHLLAAPHRIQLFDASREENIPREFASTTGHASPVISLDWAPSPVPESAQMFISAAVGD